MKLAPSRGITGAMEFSYVPPPDDLDDCIGLACSIDMRSACHATLGNGMPHACLAVLCGLRRFAPRDQGIWLDVSRRRLSYQGKALDLSEEEFLLLAAAAAGRGHFVALETIAETVFGFTDEEQGLASVRDRISAVRVRLWSAGLPDSLVEVNDDIGVRLRDEMVD